MRIIILAGAALAVFVLGSCSTMTNLFNSDEDPYLWLEEVEGEHRRNRDRERKLIKKIDESIALIESEDYGYCNSCGVEIGLKRLEARPTATLCIDCKTLEEHREKQIGK